LNAIKFQLISVSIVLIALNLIGFFTYFADTPFRLLLDLFVFGTAFIASFYAFKKTNNFSDAVFSSFLTGLVSFLLSMLFISPNTSLFLQSPVTAIGLIALFAIITLIYSMIIGLVGALTAHAFKYLSKEKNE
jgi:hypothetical protein